MANDPTRRGYLRASLRCRAEGAVDGPGDVWSREVDGPERNVTGGGVEAHTSGTRGPSRYVTGGGVEAYTSGTANRPGIRLAEE
ncbi:jg9076 [Pararge aegeria aegeria]|uniref:Jg9076 protein n=1 Tax=Pararge aegeria aegeria TaxID=348720 RepID=A0A8S4RXY3_9NEOP|nr:jg9076 [Pararge aegeria aegeria]